MKAMSTGGPPAERPGLTKRAPPPAAKKSTSETEIATVRGSISDISPLPPDESRQPIELLDLGATTVTSKSTYENTVKLKNGSLFVAHVTESLKIKIVSNEAIEVEREQRRFDKNESPIGPPIRGTATFELGKERSVRGNEVVWKFEGSTLIYQSTLVEGGFRTVIPLFRQDGSIKCIAMSGFSRENGTGPVKTIGIDGSVIEILSSKRINSSCDVVRP